MNRHRGPYVDTFAKLMHASPSEAEQAEWCPPVGTYYAWSCSCRFRYLCGGWQQVYVCGWHAGRWQQVEGRAA